MALYLVQQYGRRLDGQTGITGELVGLTADYVRSQFIYSRLRGPGHWLLVTDTNGAEAGTTRSEEDFGLFFPDDPRYANALGMIKNGQLAGVLYPSTRPSIYADAWAYVVDGQIWINNQRPTPYLVRWGDWSDFRQQYGKFLMCEPASVPAPSPPPPLEVGIGDVLCDMHYGFPWKEQGGLMLSRVSLRVPHASKLVEHLLHNAGFKGRYTNKLLVVVDFSERLHYVAAWSYDDRVFGMCELDCLELPKWLAQRREGRL